MYTNDQTPISRTGFNEIRKKSSALSTEAKIPKQLLEILQQMHLSKMKKISYFAVQETNSMMNDLSRLRLEAMARQLGTKNPDPVKSAGHSEKKSDNGSLLFDESEYEIDNPDAFLDSIEM